MKRILTFLAAIVALSACEEVIMDGSWESIRTDKNHVNFPPEGGQNAVSALNYSRWWISGGYDAAELVDNQCEYIGYVHAISSDGEEACTYDILEGSWYHVMVPEKGRSNTIIITVDPTGDAEGPREAVIEMQAGNAFTRITIAQQ